EHDRLLAEIDALARRLDAVVPAEPEAPAPPRVSAALASVPQRRPPACARARSTGSAPLLYWVVKGVLTPVLGVCFRVKVEGRDNVPRTGPVTLASNHGAVLDSLFYTS